MDIVERLRGAANIAEGCFEGCFSAARLAPSDIAEAAAEIERLRTELLEQARIIGMSGERELALRARVEKLREALRPFARHADKQTCKITMIWEDGEYKSTYTGTLKPNDFFVASATLTETQP